MMHPAKPFTRDHAAVVVNASVFVVDNPAIAAIEISIVLVVFISVLIFTDQFSFFKIISPVIKYQNEFQLRSYHYIYVLRRQEFKPTQKGRSYTEITLVPSIFQIHKTCMYVTQATQFCVQGGLQQIKGSLANPLSKINVTTSYENEAKFTLVTLGVVVSLGQSTIQPFSDPERTGLIA